jgi:hypothetical protein
MVLRPIATRGVPGTQGFMCEDVVPNKDAFVSGPMFTVRRMVRFAMKHGMCTRHVEGKIYYSSWYN